MTKKCVTDDEKVVKVGGWLPLPSGPSGPPREMVTHLVRFPARLAPAVAAILAASCGGGPKLYPVRGKVLYLDRPAEGAKVVFQPVNGGPDSPMPSGTVGPDGTFTLRTQRGDGA